MREKLVTEGKGLLMSKYRSFRNGITPRDMGQKEQAFRVTVGELQFGAKEREYLAAVIDSNRLSYGPWTQKFEASFANMHDSRYAVFCNSGTSALHIAIAALKELHGWEDGDEVIVPSITFVATVNVVLHN